MPWCMTHADQGVDLLKHAVEATYGLVLWQVGGRRVLYS